MKVKTLGFLVIAVLVLAGLSVMIFRPGNKAETESAMGQKLFDDLLIRDIDRIRIIDKDGSVSLHHNGDGWVVADRDGFPADFSRIAELVKKVQNLKIGRGFQATEDIRTRLAIHGPDQAGVPDTGKGIQVRFETEAGGSLVDLIVGKARQSDSGKGGQYLMPTGGDTIYLVDKTFKFLQTAPAEWLNRELLNIETDKVLRIDSFSKASDTPQYSLERSDPASDFELKPAPTSGPLERAEIKRVAEALSPLRIEDVEAGKNPLAGQYRFEYTLSDGHRYTVTIGEKVEGDDETARHRVRVDVAPMDTEKPTGEGKPTGPAVPTNQRSQQLTKWVYLVSEWEIESFITDPLKLVSSNE